jgi:hypothetical protein
MTTHDEQTDTTASTSTAGDSSTARLESSSAETESTAPSAPPDETESPSSETMTTETPPEQGEPPEQSTGEAESPTTETESPTTETESSTDDSLFARDDLSGLRSRWDEVQAAFVDDPKECVQKADALVAEVVEQLTTGFSEARSRLEAQWARGEEASTEVLRVALTRYRDFFQRLLSV